MKSPEFFKRSLVCAFTIFFHINGKRYLSRISSRYYLALIIKPLYFFVIHFFFFSHSIVDRQSMLTYIYFSVYTCVGVNTIGVRCSQKYCGNWETLSFFSFAQYEKGSSNSNAPRNRTRYRFLDSRDHRHSRSKIILHCAYKIFRQTFHLAL